MLTNIDDQTMLSEDTTTLLLGRWWLGKGQVSNLIVSDRYRPVGSSAGWDRCEYLRYCRRVYFCCVGHFGSFYNLLSQYNDGYVSVYAVWGHSDSDEAEVRVKQVMAAPPCSETIIHKHLRQNFSG